MIIGAAFGAVVSSLVNDVVMPPLGWLTGGLDFADKNRVIQHAGETHRVTGTVLSKDVAINYGKFINAVIAFTIQAVAMFVVIKMINALRRREASAPAPPPAPTVDQKLLTEIRDLLKKRVG